MNERRNNHYLCTFSRSPVFMRVFGGGPREGEALFTRLSLQKCKHSDNIVAWKPDNSHLLSRMKTELVWEGKYDEYGNWRPVKLPATPFPL